MQTEIIHLDTLYCDPQQDAYLKEKKIDLLSTMELQGRQDGSQNRPNTMDEYKGRVLLYIEAKVQSYINTVQQKYQPISGIGKAKLVEQEFNKREIEVQNALNNDEHTLLTAREEAKRL